MGSEPIRSRGTGAIARRRRRPLPAGQSLRAALGLTVVVAAGTAALEDAILVTQAGQYTDGVVVYSLVGVAFVAVGAVVWERRPSNRVGLLLCVTGFLIVVASSDNVNQRGFQLWASMLGAAPVGAVLHLLLAYPSGRLRSSAARALTLAGYLVTVGFEVLQVLFSPAPEGLAGFGISPVLSLVHQLQTTQHIALAVVLTPSALILGHRLRYARVESGERRALSLVYGYGIFTVLFFPLSTGLAAALHLSAYGLFKTHVVALLGIPFVFAGGVLTGGIARSGALEELGAWLGDTDADRPSLRDALAATLGDPSLELYFTGARSDALVDGNGQPVDLAQLDPRRGRVAIKGPAGPVGAVVYDRDLIGDRVLVETAGSVVGLAVERERLTAELLASQQALKESRTRLVEVGDLERRRVAQDLHDLLQGRLIVAALHAGQLAVLPGADQRTRASAAQLRDDLDAAITALRRQLHGLMPALLIERGLADAVAELTDALPLPTTVEVEASIGALPPAVATTGYFIVAEALANAIKHAAASKLSVSVARVRDLLRVEVSDDGVGGAHGFGSGLRGMADRVDALEGTLDVSSPAGRGTRIVALLPCG